MILGQQDSSSFHRFMLSAFRNGICARMEVPWPRSDSMENVPPTISTRHACPADPIVCSFRKQDSLHMKRFAVVFDFQANNMLNRLDAHLTRLACACLATLLSAAWIPSR